MLTRRRPAPNTPPRARPPRRPREVRYKPDLVAPPPGFETAGPLWLEVELGEALRRPRRRQRPGFGSKVALGQHACVFVRHGYRALVQELETDQYLVAVAPETATQGEVEIGILPIAMVLSALRNLIPQKKAAEAGAKRKGMQPLDSDDGDLEGYGYGYGGGERPSWLEVEIGGRLRKGGRHGKGPRGKRGQWTSRVALGDFAAVGVAEGYRAAVQVVENGQYLVGILPAQVLAGDVEIGVIPIAMVLSALRNLLPQGPAAQRGAKKKGLPDDEELDEAIQVATTAGYGCSGPRCGCRS